MKLTRQNYFSKEAEELYMGSSSFKAWDIFHTSHEAFGNTIAGGCEARELAKRNGEWQDEDKDVFLIGSYVHAWNSGDLQEFILEHPEMYKKNGEMYEKYTIGDKMIDTLKSDKLIQNIRSGCEFEKIYTGKIAGADFKIQIDMLNLEKGYFADLKTTAKLRKKSYKNGKKLSFIDLYDYKLQIALYAEILRQNLGMPVGEWLDSYIVVADKSKTPDKEVIYMGKKFIQEKLDYIESRLPDILEARNGKRTPVRCEECDYCKSTKTLTKPILLDDFEESLND